MTLLCDTGVLLSAADTDEPHHQACADLLRRPIIDGALQLIDLALDDARCAELIEQDAGLGLGLVDVSIAENRGITTLATLNPRDFSVVRPRHAEAFDLIP